jgi:hypothetical protein
MFDAIKMTPKGSMLVPNLIHEMPVVTPQKTGIKNRQFVKDSVGYPHISKYVPDLIQTKPRLKPGHLGEDPGINFMGFFNNN